MGKIVVSQFITLDGVTEDPGGSEGFARGGWAFQFERGDEGDRFKLDEVMASEALLLGRKTFEGFAEAWPSREGDFADKFNGMQKYVYRRRSASRSGTTPRSSGQHHERDPDAARRARRGHPRQRAATSWCRCCSRTD